MNKAIKSEILTSLKSLKNRGPSDESFGICNNLSKYSNRHVTEFWDAYGFVKQYSRGWKHHSGDVDYPVPGPETKGAWTLSHYNKWNKNTRHGRLRWQLLNYLIKKLEKELKNA